jgi:hypothetical protein
MKSWSRLFAPVFYVGFISLFAALAYGLIGTGTLIPANPFLAALRAFGVGFIAAGFTLWIALRRTEAEHTGLNPLFGFLVVAGAFLLLLGLLFSQSGLSRPAGLAGLAFMAAALLIGLIAVLFDPAFPKPVAKSWPEGGTAILTRYARVDLDELAHDDGHVDAVDDLTRIEGIGPKIEAILNAADVLTYAELAQFSPDDIREILRRAEFRAPADPSTWPEQARLAEQGAWDELEALQERLVAGRVAG